MATWSEMDFGRGHAQLGATPRRLKIPRIPQAMARFYHSFELAGTRRRLAMFCGSFLQEG